MKRISFTHVSPRSKKQYRATAFWTAALLLLFANLFAFSLAEDLPFGSDDPNGGVTELLSDDEGEPGEPGDGTDENGEPAEPGEGDPDENGEPAEPGEDESGEPDDGDVTGGGDPDDEEGAVSRLSEEITLLADPIPIEVSEETGYNGLREVADRAPTDGSPCIILLTGGALTLTYLGGGYLNIRAGQNITLTGASVTLTQEDTAYIRVQSGGKLTLGGTLTIRGGYIFVENLGALNMLGGTITGGSGVYSGGDFTMTAGTITGNGDFGRDIRDIGGGVYNTYGGDFTMYGGEISDNEANLDGGGVYNEGDFTMYDGKISDNRASRAGGGVYNAMGGISDGTFMMYDGEISGNRAIQTGGGVFNGGSGIDSWYNFTMYGGTIKGNTGRDGGGVYVDQRRNVSGGAFLKSGLITDNTASGNGGGLYQAGGASARLRFGFDFGGSDLGSAVTHIEKNEAGLGGGLYFAGGSGYEAQYNDSVLVGYNKARNGGGLYVTDYGKLFGGAAFVSHTGHNAALSGNRATTGTFLPSEADLQALRAAFPYDGPYVSGGAFLSYSRPEAGTAFTNDDINWLPVTGVTVTYRDSASHAASGMPSPAVVTVTATKATEDTFAGGVFHRIAAGPAGLGNFVFRAWKLVSDAFAFLDGDTDTLELLNGTTDDITFAPDRLIRPLVSVVLEAVWGTDSGPPGPDPLPDPPGPGPNPPGPRPPEPNPPKPEPTPVTPPAPATPLAPEPSPAPVTPAVPVAPPRPAAPATVVANVLPDLPAPAPQPPPEPAPEAESEAPAPDGPAWAIMNLVFALLSVACAALAILRFRQANTRAAGLNAAYADDPRGLGADARARRPDFTYTALTTIFALVSVGAFLLTESVSLTARRVWFDPFSPFMFALFALCAVLCGLDPMRRSRIAGESHARIPREQARKGAVMRT